VVRSRPPPSLRRPWAIPLRARAPFALLARLRLVNAALIAVFVLSVALLALALTPWPAWDRSPRLPVVVADECAQLSAGPGEPNTSVLHQRACLDR
jgi:hypothetical protein